MNVIMVFRSKLLNTYSIEKVFKTVRDSLPSSINTDCLFVEKPGFSFRNIQSLKKIAKNFKRNVLYHVTGDIHYIVFSLPRKHCILTIHDCVFIKSHKGLKGWIIRKLFLDWPVACVPIVTAISEKTRSEIIDLTHCDPAKVRVINNPVSPTVTYSGKEFNSKKPALLFIGSTPNKNLERIIEVIKSLPCSINIIGRTDEKMMAKLKLYGIEYQLENNLTDQEVNLRYSKCDIVMFPSLYEGFGLPVIEGFTAGRSVLTSNISPMKEVANDAAWLVDPYSTDSIREVLLEIINDPVARERKIELGLKIAANYSASHIASQYANLYNEVYDGLVK